MKTLVAPKSPPGQTLKPDDYTSHWIALQPLAQTNSPLSFFTLFTLPNQAHQLTIGKSLCYLVIDSIYGVFINGGIIMLYLPREEGQGLVEYALILVLVALVVIIVLMILGPAIGNIFSNVVAKL
jgi:pilus assembly protein Flp/PilA